MCSISFNVGIASYGHRVQSDLASLDLEEPLLAPSLAPLVLAYPEQASIAALLIIMAPTYHLDGMPADHLASHMGVDARLIVDKVLVD
jgi:hypothetical protein